MKTPQSRHTPARQLVQTLCCTAAGIGSRVKLRLTDVATAETLLRLVQSVPSPKAQPIKLWLALSPNGASHASPGQRPGWSSHLSPKGAFHVSPGQRPGYARRPLNLGLKARPNGRTVIPGFQSSISFQSEGRYNKFNHEDPQLLITCRGATCGSVNIPECGQHPRCA